VATELHGFISSKMQELAPERKALQELLPTLGRDTFKLNTWAFEENATASNKPIRDIYLEALQRSALYIGLFWNQFGEWTIDEFEQATQWGIERHLYVKNIDPERRDPRLQAFLDKQTDVRFGVTPRWFTDLEDLKQQFTRSINKWLLDRQIAYHSATNAILAHIPDDVPEQPKMLIGRDDLISDVGEMLAENSRVLLRGFGGMGKTALAATVAAQYVSEGKGSVIWLKAGAGEADTFFEAIGRAFGAQQTIASTSGDERLQAVRHVLAETKALLVLDDVWNGSALVQMIKALPRHMPLLATSRHRFPLDEIVEIGELKPAQALQLLSLHVRGRDFRDDPDAERLCEVLGYHSFALEIASKTLKVYQLTPAELLQRIEGAPHDLSMPANFGEQGRTGIKALLDTSVNVLSKPLYDAFVALGGMFEPSATPELLALVMKLDPRDVDEALGQLELRGLAGISRFNRVKAYRLHDLAYSYARTLFLNKGSGVQPVIEACRDYAVGHKDDLDALDVEQSNLLEAAEAASDSSRADLLLDTIRSLTVDGPYFAARGYTALSLKLIKLAVDAAKARNELETAHYLLSKLGNAYADFVGDGLSAFEAYNEALDLAQQLGDRRREAILLTVIGKVLFHQHAADSDTYYERAEAIARQIQDDFALGFVLHHRGYQFINQPEPDYERGRDLSDESAKIAEKLGLTDIHFWSLLNRGSCEHELGQLDLALATHQEAYALAAEQNNHYWMAGVLRSIGEDHHRLNNRSQAQEAFDESITLWHQIKVNAQVADLTKYMTERGYTAKPQR
jgi:tetratricopeptide (TPR) repeat protein